MATSLLQLTSPTAACRRNNWRRIFRRIAADRGAAGGGRGVCGTLNEQLRPSALWPPLPAAKAALVALMQNTSSAAAAISIVNLMAGPPKIMATSRLSNDVIDHQSRRMRRAANRPGPCIKQPCMHCTNEAPGGFRSRARRVSFREDSSFRDAQICQINPSQGIFRRRVSPSTSWRWPRSRARSSPSCGWRSARTPAWRPGTTGTRRRRWRCATASCTAG